MEIYRARRVSLNKLHLDNLCLFDYRLTSLLCCRGMNTNFSI